MDKILIDIKGLNKGELLDALVQGTRYNGPQFVFASEFGSYLSPIVNESEEKANTSYVDYYKNKPIKTDLRKDLIDPRLYDRDAGNGTFAKIVIKMRNAETKK